MEYTVGSLAELITGKNTPNKVKVIEKEFKPKKSVNIASNDDERNILPVKRKRKYSDNGTDHTFHKPYSKGIKLKKGHNKVPDNLAAVDSIQKNSIIKRKRKHSHNETDNVSDDSPKKNKHGSNTNASKSKKKHKHASENTHLESEDASNDAVKTEDSNTDPSEDSPDDLNTSTKSKPFTKYNKNAERRVKEKIKEERNNDPELNERTVFVGNVPVNTPKKKIKKQFSKYGEIESIRIRGVAPADPKLTKKLAVLRKELHPKRTTACCFIRFKNKEDAANAPAEDGQVFREHHLRVQLCSARDKPDESKAIFVGNLTFDAEEEELWKLFESCGPISHVRIVRDQLTGMGKGFGYVNFKDADSVQLALEMENVQLKNRELRITLCNLGLARRNKKRNKDTKISKPGTGKFRKRFDKPKPAKFQRDANASEPNKQRFADKSLGYQGSKFDDKKKKKKLDRGLIQKKKLAKKIAPKADLQ